MFPNKSYSNSNNSTTMKRTRGARQQLGVKLSVKEKLKAKIYLFMTIKLLKKEEKTTIRVTLKNSKKTVPPI